jgi:lipoteichoic acid synthase
MPPSQAPVVVSPARRQHKPGESTSRGDGEADELFVAWSCLAVLMVIARGKVLAMIQWPITLLPIAAYQDLAMAAAVCWLTLKLLAVVTGIRMRRVAIFFAWMLCVLWAAYTVVNEVVFRFLRTSLSWRLLVLSSETQGVRGLRALLGEAVTVFRIVEVVAAPIVVVTVAKLARRFAPGLVKKARRVAGRPAFAGLLLLYFLAGSAWASRFVSYAPIVSNPEWELASSFFAQRSPRLARAFPASYLDDFRPAGAPAATELSGRLPPGTNIVIVVMESVGTRRLELSGASYHDSPELLRLSAHAANFTRMYVSMPFTSNAMGALFCSLYPSPGWGTITNEFTDLPLPTLASVLATHGYRSAFIHAQPLAYDSQGKFLGRHGFEVIEGKEYSTQPHDQVLVDEAADWIRRGRGGPFLLVLWTDDTHEPYTPPRHLDFGESDPPLSRYLDAIASTDAVIGRLASQLDAMGLGDNTVLVVTGDHGEAFGDHGQFFHDMSTYEEEVRIPFMIVSRRLFPRPRRIDSTLQQVDMAPTLLDLLGYQAPAQWQGRSMFSPARAGRAYLIADSLFFRLGFVDGSLKYIYDYNSGQSELYDLDADPHEQRNLIDEPSYAGFAQEAPERLSAWLAFQNPYLERLAHGQSVAESSGPQSPTVPSGPAQPATSSR